MSKVLYIKTKLDRTGVDVEALVANGIKEAQERQSIFKL